MQINPLTINHHRLICLLLIISLMSGCAWISNSGTNKANPASSSGNTAALLTQHWQADGKLAIRQIATQNTRGSAHTLRFNWHQQGENYTALLSGPLGFGRIEIQQTKQRISLTRGKTRVEAKDVDQLFFQQTGLSLPVSYLRYWALGIPAPQHGFTATPTSIVSPEDDAGGSQTSSSQPSAKAIKGFLQDGWDVSYTGAQQIDSYTLPVKLIADNGDIKVVIAFKHWDLPLSTARVGSFADK